MSNEFKSREKRLDILVCNAGVMCTPYAITKVGDDLQTLSFVFLFGPTATLT